MAASTAAAQKKMWKLGSKTPSQIEVDVANAFLDLENSKAFEADANKPDKPVISLADLKFSSAKVRPPS